MAAAKKAASKTTAARKAPAKKAAAKKPARTAPAAAPATVAAEPETMPTAAGPATDSFVPIVDRTPFGIVALVLGIIGLGGVGTIIAGVKDGRHKGRDITFGVLQLLIPFAGWAWGLVWGILIFVKGR